MELSCTQTCGLVTDDVDVVPCVCAEDLLTGGYTNNAFQTNSQPYGSKL